MLPDERLTAIQLNKFDRGSEAFMYGIRFACGLELEDWTWQRFYHNVTEYVRAMNWDDYEIKPFYTETIKVKDILIPKVEYHIDEDYDVRSRNGNGTWSYTSLMDHHVNPFTRKGCYSNHLQTFNSPASGWWDVELRFFLGESEQDDRFTQTVPFDDTRDWEEFEEGDEVPDDGCDTMIDWPYDLCFKSRFDQELGVPKHLF